MKKHQHTAGYSFVEVLVSIAILLIAIVGPMTIASTGLQNATFAREQNTAFFLAQEGIEGVVYLRENAGLRHLQNGSVDTWGWVTANIPAACRSGSPCRINIDTHTITECDPVSECNLYLHSSGDVRYRHQAGGENTPYNRRLLFTVNGDTLRVRSIVFWRSNAFDATKRVELETYLYNIYENN